MLIFVLIAFLPRLFLCVQGRDISSKVISSIETEYGDIYDCFDIYNQPAFDHPALKYHKLQMEPSSYPEGMPRSNSMNQVTSIGLKDGGCPKGTVPIRRHDGKDLSLVAKSKNHFRMTADDDEFLKENHGYAAIKCQPGSYYGARAIMNVWQPTVNGSDSFSLSQIWVTAGYGRQLNTIEAGWIVYPKSFGTQVRHFVFWTADRYNTTGCYNTDCSGYVQLNQNIPVDAPIAQFSTYNGEQHEFQIDIFKDPRSGNWYLSRDGLTIGYWPMSIFGEGDFTLSVDAERIDWGGETEFTGSDPNPPMGSGHFPEEGYGKAAYVRGIQLIRDKMQMTLSDATDCLPFETDTDCYRVKQNPNLSGKLTDNHILFGGRGC